MDGFPTLPIEISRFIIRNAVIVRGIKRAARLRFVSRSWNHEVIEAIVRSDILEDLVHPQSSPHWPNYLTFKIMGKGPHSRPLVVIRQIAERILAFCGDDEGYSSDDDDASRHYVFKICQLCKINRCPPYYKPWLDVPQCSESISDMDEVFKEALLTAASYMGITALVKQLLPGIQDYPQLISQHGQYEHDPLLGWPIDVAAYMGSVEVVRMLLSTIREPDYLENARDCAIDYAGRANQEEILDLCLHPTYASHNPVLTELIAETTSIEIFDRVFSLCKDYPTYDKRKACHRHPEEILGDLLWDCLTAAIFRGDLAMVKHLSEDFSTVHSAHRTAYQFHRNDNTVRLAAGYGHTDVLAYLLGKGIIPDTKSTSLDAASQHGNPNCVRLLLKIKNADEVMPGRALIEAVKRENDVVVRLLLESGIAFFSGDMKSEAMNIAEKDGLESMTKILHEYN